MDDHNERIAKLETHVEYLKQAVSRLYDEHNDMQTRLSRMAITFLLSTISFLLTVLGWLAKKILG